MDQRRLILLGALLLTVLAASFYWYGEGGNNPPPLVSEKFKQFAPETIVAGFDQTTFGETGIRQYHMKADTVTHYSMQSAAEMAKPIITFFKKGLTAIDKQQETSEEIYFDQTDWVAKAKNGVIQNDGETMVLMGNVNVIKPFENADALTFTTESLLIKPNEQIAKTDEPVTLKQSQHITKAKGLVIDIASGKVELVSQVRSQYVPAAL